MNLLLNQTHRSLFFIRCFIEREHGCRAGYSYSLSDTIKQMTGKQNEI